MTIRHTTLGTTGPTVGALGLGCMGMSGMYGRPTDEECLRTVHAALDAGITLLDTGDHYGSGHNDMLLGRALRGRDRDDYLLSVKFGGMRAPDGAMLGIGITAYGGLSHNLIGAPKHQYEPGDVLRAISPRLQGDNLGHNLDLVAGLEPIAARHGLTVTQLAIAWVVAPGRELVPLIGTTGVSRLQPAVDALAATLTTDDLADIDRALPAGAVAG